MDAMRVGFVCLLACICCTDLQQFHYLSLVRFGTNMLANFRKAQATAERFRKNNFEDVAAIKRLNSQIGILRARVAELEECEKAFKPWKERGPKIKYYLGVFEEVTRWAARYVDFYTG